MDAATAEARLKNMTAWDTVPELTQADIDMLLTLARRTDSHDRDITDANYVPTWQLEWAAAEAWLWKAACLAGNYNLGASGTTLNRSQAFDHAEKMYEVYRKKSSSQPRSIRSVGNLVADRLGNSTPYPWWFAETNSSS